MANAAPAGRFAAIRRHPHAWLTALLLLAAVLDFGGLHFGAALDRIGGDLFLKWQVAGRPPPQDIVLVDIDQASLDDPQMLDLAGNWPWPRLTHGELVTWLAAQRPRAIVFDLTFSEPDVFNPESDQAFAQAIADSTVPVYLPIVIPDDGAGSRLADLPQIMGVERGPDADPAARLPIVAPKALPPEVWRTGHINFLTDADQIGRRAELYRLHAGWRIPSLMGRVARDAQRVLPRRQDVILHWYGAPFPRVSYRTLYLAALSAGRTAPHDFAGKTVIIGSTAPGLVDFRPTPLGTRTPGPELLATTLANLQHGDWLAAAPAWWSPLLALLLVLGAALGFARSLHPSVLVGSAAAVSLAVLAGAYALLGANLQWQPFSALAYGWLAVFGCGILSYLQEKQRREHAVLMFNRFLDPRVVQALTATSTLADAEVGRSQELSVLFSDIRGFTSMSETRPPEQVVALLNRYFEQQVEVVFAHGGTLDKFIGDAIMAFWGAPVATPDHAVQAVSAALRMSAQLEHFRAGLDHEFEIGIGVHTGPAVVGFIGTSRRLDYTAIGDAVNLASRIEGQTKGVARVLVSESTRDACGDAFEFVAHGAFHVKGREQPVRLFEPREKK